MNALKATTSKYHVHVEKVEIYDIAKLVQKLHNSPEHDVLRVTGNYRLSVSTCLDCNQFFTVSAAKLLYMNA